MQQELIDMIRSIRTAITVIEKHAKSENDLVASKLAYQLKRATAESEQFLGKLVAAKQ